jgi:hypothetical protein
MGEGKGEETPKVVMDTPLEVLWLGCDYAMSARHTWLLIDPSHIAHQRFLFEALWGDG